jgi:chromosome partitioning protein
LLPKVEARAVDQHSHGGDMNCESSAKRNSIAVMNTKGGVGKSTIVLALAETLSAFHGKNVLIVDSDSQASASAMLMTTNSLFKLQQDGATIVDYLVKTVLHEESVEWPKFVVRDVSDVDDARSVYLIPSDMELTLLERKISEADRHGMLRSVISDLLDQVRKVFDIVLIDCPPGLSILTESWLREADFHLSPTKPDYVSVCGLEVFRRFKALNPEMGFAENIGVLVNMKDRMSPSDEDYTAWLRSNAENRCFEQPIPRINALQDAARFSQLQRSYQAKYPGEAGNALRALAAEVLARLDGSSERKSDGGERQRAIAG